MHAEVVQLLGYADLMYMHAGNPSQHSAADCEMHEANTLKGMRRSSCRSIIIQRLGTFRNFPAARTDYSAATFTGTPPSSDGAPRRWVAWEAPAGDWPPAAATATTPLDPAPASRCTPAQHTTDAEQLRSQMPVAGVQCYSSDEDADGGPLPARR